MKQGKSKEAVRAFWEACTGMPGLREWKRAEGSLEQYVLLLLQGSKRRGLLAASQRNEDSLWEHIYDSIQALKLVADSGAECVLDAGSGAGLPGIPLAIAFPKTSFVLAERMAPKAEFLELVAAKCALRNVSVEAHDLTTESMEAIAPGLVLMRAVVNAEERELPNWLCAPRIPWVVFATEGNRDKWISLAKQSGFSLCDSTHYRDISGVKSRFLLKFVSA